MTHQILSAVAEALASAVAGLVVALLTQQLRRLNLNLSAQQEAQVRYFVERAVHIVAETVEAEGPAKLQAAVALVQQRFPALPAEQIADTIHAEIARQRADVGNQLFQPKP